MSSADLAGTGHLLRLILRLDRVKLSLWLVGLLTIIAITPFSLRAILDAEAEADGVTTEVVLAEQALLLETNGATIALQGPPDALDTFGGRYAFEIGAFTLAIVALMSILLIARHTRAEEESGRAELVRAAAVGRWSAITAVGIVAVGINLMLGLGTSLVFIADGQAVGPSLLYGSSLTMCGLVFAAIALVWVQVFEYGRAATGMSLAGLAVAFALRAVGDVRDNWLSAVSPLGWPQAINPFGSIDYWPYVVATVAVVAATGLAVLLAANRDVGAGLIEQQPGPATAAPGLATPLGFAWRLQKSTVLWWSAGLAFIGAIYGSVISSIDDFIEENEAMLDVLESLGMSGDALREGFITVILSMSALIAIAGVIQVQLRPLGEEGAGRAESILSTALSRRRWLGAHAAITVLAAPAFMIASGLGLILADAMVVGAFEAPGATLVAALVRVPALWAIAGIGVALYGTARRWAAGVWVVFGLVVVIFLFGELLRLPGLAMNLSPIGHLTHLPGGDQDWPAIVVLCVIAVAGLAFGLLRFDRRDLDTS